MAGAPENLTSTLGGTLPSQWQWWCALVRTYDQMGNISGALSFALASIPQVEDPERVFLPLGTMLYMDGMHDEASAVYEKILVCQPSAQRTHGALLVLRELYGLDDVAQSEFERWNESFVVPLARQCIRASTPPEIGRSLRIGFVSNDFVGDHSLNTVLAPWFIGNGRRSDTYVLYSNGRHPLPPHGLFLDAADMFTDVSSFSDEELDARIRRDRIDILVDMISHGGRNRLLAYARKPAPIIVSWIGLGIPTGVETVDYLLADESFVPSGTTGRYREKIVRLPLAAMAWCPPAAAPPVGPVPSIGRGYAVFGNLTRVVKFRPETIALWAQVLHRVPDAKLMLKDRRLLGVNAQRILSMFERQEIGAERLILKEGSSQGEHLAAYGDVDVVLDCVPQSGGVSTLEALWMGVPVISLWHPTKPTGRFGGYILSNCGFPALATDCEDDFVALAERLARSPDLLVSLRRGLRPRLARSPLCDVEAFQRGVAAAFRQMWIRYCNNQEPESFTVSAS